MHLRECGPCLERYDLQRTVKQLVARSCSESAPESLRDRVRVQLREVQIRITEGRLSLGSSRLAACRARFRDTAPSTDFRRTTMGKTGRKRRARKKKGANHGKRPNA